LIHLPIARTEHRCASFLGKDLIMNGCISDWINQIMRQQTKQRALTTKLGDFSIGKCEGNLVVIEGNVFSSNLQHLINSKKTEKGNCIYGLNNMSSHRPSPVMEILCLVAWLMALLLPVLRLVIEIIELCHDFLKMPEHELHLRLWEKVHTAVTARALVGVSPILVYGQGR